MIHNVMVHLKITENLEDEKRIAVIDLLAQNLLKNLLKTGHPCESENLILTILTGFRNLLVLKILSVMQKLI